MLILLKSEGVHQVEFMYLSLSMSHTRQVRVTIGDSWFCCYVHVTFFEGLLGATTGAVRISPVSPHTHTCTAATMMIKDHQRTLLITPHNCANVMVKFKDTMSVQLQLTHTHTHIHTQAHYTSNIKCLNAATFAGPGPCSVCNRSLGGSSAHYAFPPLSPHRV